MASEETRRQLLVAVAACDDKKGEDTRILELDPQDSGLADFFLITSASNDRQVVAISDEIEFRLKKEFGLYATSVEGRKQGEWVLLDYVDIVIHVFLAEKRAFYDIERLRKSARNLTSADVEAELTSALKKKTIAVREGAPAEPKAGKKAVKKAVKTLAKKAVKKAAVKTVAGKSPATKTVALKTPKGGAALAKKAAKKSPLKAAAKKAAVKTSAVKKAVAPAKKAVAKKTAVNAPAVKKAALKKAVAPAKKAVAKKAAVKKTAAVTTASVPAPAEAPMKLGVMAPTPIAKLGAKPPILKTEAPAFMTETPAVDLAASAESKPALKSAAKKSKK